MGNLLKSCTLGLTLLLTTSPSVSGQTDEKHLITLAQGIGPIKIGMSIGAVKFILGPGRLVPLHYPLVPGTDKTPGEDLTYGAWRAPASSGKFYVIFLTTFPITYGKAIGVGLDGDPGYATPEGVHVGSTKEEVRAAFGEPSKREHGFTKISPGSDSDLIAYVERGIALSINKDKVDAIFVCYPVDECSFLGSSIFR